MKKTVVELFAGVGGFRVGLNEVKNFRPNGTAIENNNFQFIWSNQWEPSTKLQHAFDCYQMRFGHSKSHSNQDICKVNKQADIPHHTLLVGGFPCQDYSVARSLSNEKGIEGKKGVLWWEIHEILKVKRPPFVLLENVDRLLKSPSTQRGRDFGIMLKCLIVMGYMVEWRIINAADYGHPQRRRRIFIFAYQDSTAYSKKRKSLTDFDTIIEKSIFIEAFPIKELTHSIKSFKTQLDGLTDIYEVSKEFAFPFDNYGFASSNLCFTTVLTPICDTALTMLDILHKEPVSEHYFINDKSITIKGLKSKKNITRVKNGVSYNYAEGAIAYPDNLNLPGRTMLTSEATVNRSTHIVTDYSTNQYRFITPIEAERLNEFPDNWTNTGMPERKRYYMMGNALVCGVVTKLGKRISHIIDNEH